MNPFYLELSFRVPGNDSPEGLEAHLDHIAECLPDLDGIIDADIAASLTERLVDFTLTVEAEDEASALGVAMGAIRSAIHGAEGCTPGWEDQFHKLQQTVHSEGLIEA